MNESREMYSLRLPKGPPVVQVRGAPGETNVPSKTYMRDWVSTSRAGLLADPRLRNAPSLAKFFCCQYLKEWPSRCSFVLQLFSTHHLCLCMNNLPRTAVHKTAAPGSESSRCWQQNGNGPRPAAGRASGNQQAVQHLCGC